MMMMKKIRERERGGMIIIMIITVRKVIKPQIIVCTGTGSFWAEKVQCYTSEGSSSVVHVLVERSSLVEEGTSL
jgi:hypothetical protein